MKLDPTTAVSFTDVMFTYGAGDASPALNGLTFSLARGEFACIVGGNGSGKSTLAKHIDALLLPDAGSVQVLGHDTTEDGILRDIRTHCGMVFQNPDDQLVASIVEDEVAFGPANLGLPADELRTRVDEALQAVGLSACTTRETATLSGGQKQRLAIAGALAMRPELIILDEATSMLDPRGRADVMAICERLHDQGMTVIMITHTMEEAAHADRVYVLDQGKLAAQGAPEEVLGNEALLDSLHLSPTFATTLAGKLRAQGIDMPACVRDDAVREALVALKAQRGGQEAAR